MKRAYKFLMILGLLAALAMSSLPISAARPRISSASGNNSTVTAAESTIASADASTSAAVTTTGAAQSTKPSSSVSTDAPINEEGRSMAVGIIIAIAVAALILVIIFILIPKDRGGRSGESGRSADRRPKQ